MSDKFRKYALISFATYAVFITIVYCAFGEGPALGAAFGWLVAQFVNVAID